MKFLKKIKKAVTRDNLALVKDKALELRKIITLDCYERYVVPYLPPPPLTQKQLEAALKNKTRALVELYMSEEYGHQLSVFDLLKADAGFLTDNAVMILNQADEAGKFTEEGEANWAYLTERKPAQDHVVSAQVSLTEPEAEELDRIRKLYKPRKNSPSTLRSAQAQVNHEVDRFSHWWRADVNRRKIAGYDDDGNVIYELPEEERYKQGNEEEGLPLLQAKFLDELTDTETERMFVNITNYMREYCLIKKKEKEYAAMKAELEAKGTYK